ncbi:hypothetical protein BKA67DRAFT_579856, partial [Truncatella angustata]
MERSWLHVDLITTCADKLLESKSVKELLIQGGFGALRTSFIVAMLLSMLALAGLSMGSVQYCHNKSPQAPVYFCTAVSSWVNPSTSSVEWWVTFGVQRLGPEGWYAIGLGSGMYGALMFIVYV